MSNFKEVKKGFDSGSKLGREVLKWRWIKFDGTFCGDEHLFASHFVSVPPFLMIKSCENRGFSRGFDHGLSHSQASKFRRTQEFFFRLSCFISTGSSFILKNLGTDGNNHDPWAIFLASFWHPQFFWGCDYGHNPNNTGVYPMYCITGWIVINHDYRIFFFTCKGPRGWTWMDISLIPQNPAHAHTRPITRRLQFIFIISLACQCHSHIVIMVSYWHVTLTYIDMFKCFYFQPYGWMIAKDDHLFSLTLKPPIRSGIIQERQAMYPWCVGPVPLEGSHVLWLSLSGNKGTTWTTSPRPPRHTFRIFQVLGGCCSRCLCLMQLSCLVTSYFFHLPHVPSWKTGGCRCNHQLSTFLGWATCHFVGSATISDLSASKEFYLESGFEPVIELCHGQDQGWAWGGLGLDDDAGWFIL